jgi:hypothetical protein
MSQDSSLTQSGHSIRQALTAYRVALSRRLAAPDYGYTCSIDQITASSSHKSRSSYPYKLSKPVFWPSPDYNLRMSWQLSRVDALKTETHLSVSSGRQDWLRD